MVKPPALTIGKFGFNPRWPICSTVRRNMNTPGTVDPSMMCPECQGTGTKKIGMNESITCPRCKGTGKVSTRTAY